MWTSDLAWFVVGFVNTLLAVLKIEAHVIILEFCIVFLDYFLAIFNLSERTQSARVKKFVLGIIVKVDTREGFSCEVENAHSKKFTVYSMEHVVSTLELGIYLLINVLAILAFVRFILILLCNSPI